MLHVSTSYIDEIHVYITEIDPPENLLCTFLYIHIILINYIYSNCICFTYFVRVWLWLDP